MTATPRSSRTGPLACKHSRMMRRCSSTPTAGGDGPSSFVRSLYLPAAQRQYVGYIAWRGTVPESEASAATRAIFHRSVTVHMMKQHHCIMYMIPGPNGSLEPGERLLNFLWYT